MLPSASTPSLLQLSTSYSWVPVSATQMSMHSCCVQPPSPVVAPVSEPGSVVVPSPVVPVVPVVPSPVVPTWPSPSSQAWYSSGVSTMRWSA